MLDPIHLKTLQVVLRTGSFAAAAAELQYTPSAVSQQMSALERSCGVALFERQPHQVRPTDAAGVLAETGASVLADLAAVETAIGAVARGEAGRLRIGAFPTAGAALLPAALAALQRHRPAADVELVEGEPDALLPRLVDGRLDLAVVYEYDTVPGPPTERLMRVELRREPLRVLLAAREHGDDAPVRLAELRERRFVAPLEGSPGADNLDRMCAAAHFRPRIGFRSNDYAVVRGLVGAGLGVAVVPELALARDRTVRALPLAGRQVRRRIYAVYRSSARNPLLAPLLAALATEASR